MNSTTREVQNPALSETAVFDITHPDIHAGIASMLRGEPEDDVSKAVAFYYFVRDQISYQVFGTGLREEDLKGSAILRGRKGFCLHKAILFAALCRSEGIPCHISAAPVRNHVSSPSLSKLVGGDIFLHWFNEIQLNGKWLKAAPVFSRLLCQMYNIPPLEFDGHSDAHVQGHVANSTMEYLEEPIRFEAPAVQELVRHVAATHPLMVSGSGRVPSEREIAAL
ncbi:MAG: transglutaminase domain-containing protein [Roseicyclus sp.]|nr:transglutaminase domain-containing protein [Roseicyclus sp.]